MTSVDICDPHKSLTGGEVAGRKIAGPGRLGSMKAVKDSFKSNRQDANVLTLKAETEETVRFLEEPPDWHGYYEHWGKDGPFPCTEEDDGTGCDSDNDQERRRSFKYLANVYSIDKQKVMAVKMPKTLVETLTAFYTKYKTICDRDYDLSRTGSGMEDTKYFAAPDAPKRIKMERFKLIDLDDLLLRMVGEGSDEVDDEDDEDEEMPRRRRSSSRSTKPRSTRRKSPWDDEDEDEDEYEDQSDGDDERSSHRGSTSRRAVKKRRTRSSGMDEFDEETTHNPARRRGTTKKSESRTTVVRKSSKPVRRTVKRSR